MLPRPGEGIGAELAKAHPWKAQKCGYTAGSVSGLRDPRVLQTAIRIVF